MKVEGKEIRFKESRSREACVPGAEGERQALEISGGELLAQEVSGQHKALLGVQVRTGR